MKTFKIPLFFLILGIGFCLWYFSFSTNAIEEGKNVFSSSYYKSYREMLKDYLEKFPLKFSGKNLEFNQMLAHLSKELEEPLGSPGEQRLSHQTFVTELRALAALRLSMTKKESQDSSVQSFDQLIQWIFLQADLRKAMESFLYHYVPLPADDLLLSVTKALGQLKENKQFNGVLLSGREVDGFMNGNLPSLQDEVENDKKTKVIRMSTPATVGTFVPRFWSKSTIQPEFLAFLAQNHSHLYINLMKRSGLEAARSHALEDLEREYPKFYLVGLDKNSPFYRQEGEEWEAPMETEKFKSLFLKELINKNGNYYWSSRLNLGDWFKEVESLMKRVQEEQFAQNNRLTLEERLDFIELVYIKIIDALVQKWEPNSMNITCQQGMDRGPSLLVLWMLERGNRDIKELEALLLTPPLLIHNRPSYPSKIKRFLSAAERILHSKKD